MAELTAKQARFVEEYLIDLNATQAAIRAGYSQKNADGIASQLMAKTQVQAAIDAARANRSEETQINAAWVLKRLAAEAEADLADLYDDTGAIKPIQQWPKIWRQGLVAGVKHQELRDSEGNRTGEFIIDVKVSDRIRRLELIGKHIGVNAFQDIVEHKGLDSLADRLARAAKRTSE
jgi:Phage terminase, small subunit